MLYLKPFLKTLEPGFIRNDDLRRRGGSNLDSDGSYSLSFLKSRSRRDEDTLKEFGRLSRAPHTVTVVAGGRANDDWDRGSQHSQIQIIREVRTFAVDQDSAP